jgi:uncharacterized protein (DUF2249 family)
MSSTKTNTWISVDRKEPPFNEKLLFADTVGQFECGAVKQVISDHDGKTISFVSNGEDYFFYKFWMKPEPPTK